MKIAIVGASGRVGSLILKEAKQRNLNVTAIVRDRQKITNDVPILEKNVYQLTTEDIQKFDVLVSALGFWENFQQFSTSMEHLITILTGQKTRLIVVGGASSLFVNSEHTERLKDTPDFPKTTYQIGNAMVESLLLLEKSKDVHWTYISPAKTFDANGEVTGHYFTAGDELTYNQDGNSYISYGDYARAMVDEIENNQYPNQHFSVYS
ncbi:NAD(P)-dependent oxidoreductase [Melissococcus plutonius]|uniref:Rrf2-linked NADH-flavin reductase n=1 Tax=Melissococcus plutonius (strain ATCC 35311 / DSM 29964 / CIP 104052 / LMG 20360 / NCIMB 702443) TaxID=940190 RepID=F3YCE7_MELPT|nr:NAD(P)H-binding protein [Melissococcus plutonius]AIM25378.1 putative NADH-flavin reductase [Melissococcus plutonius S1]KMT24101.1 putative NADH-flavin reductase [Melissococcus plutonius]KMT24254.1 putative NADH-flavin reductase [Melissococcus plutonius]KMT25599.1 putative NADH-flavin reductase [Melissococcus plutonius]KMT28746.1 putative NADH-flavin reductase [Melissococcus plutonius]